MKKASRDKKFCESRVKATGHSSVPVKLKHTNFIDAFLPDTKVIIEQKSLSEDITKSKAQSDGSTLTPYEQAQRYGSSLPYSMRPRWIFSSTQPKINSASNLNCRLKPVKLSASFMTLFTTNISIPITQNRL